MLSIFKKLLRNTFCVIKVLRQQSQIPDLRGKRLHLVTIFDVRAYLFSVNVQTSLFDVFINKVTNICHTESYNLSLER